MTEATQNSRGYTSAIGDVHQKVLPFPTVPRGMTGIGNGRFDVALHKALSRWKGYLASSPISPADATRCSTNVLPINPR